jgi:poly(ADP-ribose) glycohydrolase ARH3
MDGERVAPRLKVVSPASAQSERAADSRIAAAPRAEEMQSKFVGALLGVMVGDTFGAPVEGWTCERIGDVLRVLSTLPPNSPYRGLYDNVVGVLSGHVAPGRGNYTDDTQMTMAVAESLLSRGGFDGEDVAAHLAAACDGKRSYGPGVYSVLQSLRRGVPWTEAGGRLFSGEGSLGNGGAARVTPIALLYQDDDPACLRHCAELSASITHTHPLGREGAALLAAAVARAVRLDPAQPLDTTAFLHDLRAMVSPTAGIYREALDATAELLTRQPTHREVADRLGNRIEAPRSVPTALYAFLANAASFRDAVLFAIRLGGDTDTIGAMTGALAGAYHGVDAIPVEWLRVLENDAKGMDYLRDLAGRLHALYLMRGRA